MFTDEELEIIRWLANLVKAQATSEKNTASSLYMAYNDRNFVHNDLAMARAKIAKCDRILSVLNAEALD